MKPPEVMACYHFLAPSELYKCRCRSVCLSVGPKTEFEFLALRPFSLSKLALIDADEDDDEENDDEEDDDEDEEDDDDDDEEDVEEDEKVDIFQTNIFFHFFHFFEIIFF